jgi:hypothetical protein
LTGACDKVNPYLIPNRNRTLCILPDRLDVAHHYLMTGGHFGFKERYERLASRMLSYSQFFITGKGKSTGDSNRELSDVKEVQTLFNSEAYKRESAVVCEGREYHDHFQLSTIVQLPGQQVPTHYDSPWFWGASRLTHPQWLLVVMHSSGLFEHLRVPQAQGVAYLHDWQNATDLAYHLGGFYYWAKGPGNKVDVYPPVRNSAIILDGSKIMHGTEPFRPSEDYKLPLLDRSDVNELRFNGNGKWTISANGKSKGEIDTQDLRISLVWRTRCFKDADEQKRWKETKTLSLEDVIDPLVQDLRKRGRLGANEARPEPLDLAMLLLDEYVNYPLPDRWMPFNYCMLPKKFENVLGVETASKIADIMAC